MYESLIVTQNYSTEGRNVAKKVHLDDSRMLPADVSAARRRVCYSQTGEISELFQIRKGKIGQIEAGINSVPYGMKSEVWDK